MTTHKKWTNRKERKELTRRLQSENPGLEVIHPQAAGIDVGNSAHYVAVRGSRRKVVFKESPAAAGVVGTVNRRFKVLWKNRSLVFAQNRQFPQCISGGDLV